MNCILCIGLVKVKYKCEWKYGHAAGCDLPWQQLPEIEVRPPYASQTQYFV